ncbi:hypothetical protein STCU_06303 [Strigomonas culicis]|nr:hypothetical protein STCU_07964 [Strigomonas culicis]EPY26136.1 hypothetical protein STCU_06303 [Strigomonas culicis]|eukprot:EPY22995.1 hypothetical protein STCU_07964 [Strigomonas culicis]
MKSEEEIQRSNEPAAALKAALVIQHHWRHYRQRREDLQEVENFHPTDFTASGTTHSDEGDEEDSEMLNLTPEERRQVLVDEYRRLTTERESLVEQNLAYQRIMARHLAEKRSRKGETDVPLITSEAVQQYWGLVRQLAEERTHMDVKKRAAEEELERMREYNEETINEALMQDHNFREYMRDIAGSASFMRSSKGIPEEEVQAFLDKEEEQRCRIRTARIRYIQLVNFAKRIHHAMVEKDRQNKNSGMYLIDFEQLKIENTNLSEKIEERNEDISKLRRKVTTTIHVLTHMKEKSEFMKSENEQLRRQVTLTDDELGGVRDQLAQTKKRRDGFASSTVKMKEKMPLVGPDDLLLDYEKRKDDINKARVRVVELTKKHGELSEYIRKQQPVIENLKRAISNYPT